MRAFSLLAVAAIALVASAVASGGSGQATTSLRVAYWEDGVGAQPDRVWTVRCDPAAGTLPRPARACRELDAGGRALFRPTPPDAVCTEIYGGPQRARVTGMLDGRYVWSTFARNNGCQIGRWAKVSPWLLPPGGVTS